MTTKKKTKRAKKKRQPAAKSQSAIIREENENLKEQLQLANMRVSEIESELNAMPQPDWSLGRRIIWVRQRVKKLGKDTKISTGSGRDQFYKGITHDKVTGFIRPKLNDAGILVWVDCDRWQSAPTGMVAAKSGRIIEQFRGDYIVEFENAFNPHDKRAVRVPAHADDRGDKGPGKANSYALKYALLKTFLIETGEDDEERIDPEDGADTRTMGEVEDVSNEVFAVATELFGDDAKRKLDVMARRKFNVKAWADIPVASYEQAILSLRSHHARLVKEKELNS